jgi:lysophospholipase L1-like esterase
VALDGVWQEKLVLTPGVASYELAAELPGEAHQIELYRRSEAQNGVTRFGGFDFGDGALLAPPPRSRRRLEVIGDSGSSGFGVEGVGLGPDCPGFDWAAQYANFHRAWGARLGERLGAEVYAAVYSGKGIVRNIWREDVLTMPRIYGRANPLEPESAYDPSSYEPHAVVMMLGGNDFQLGLPVDDGPLPLATFEAALDDFIEQLHAAHPSAHVVLVLSPSTPELMGDDRIVRSVLREGLSAVGEQRRAAGDEHVHYVEPPQAVAAELQGCNGHGTPEYHDRVAADLEEFVRDLVGW